MAPSSARGGDLLLPAAAPGRRRGARRGARREAPSTRRGAAARSPAARLRARPGGALRSGFRARRPASRVRPRRLASFTGEAYRWRGAPSQKQEESDALPDDRAAASRLRRQVEGALAAGGRAGSRRQTDRRLEEEQRARRGVGAAPREVTAGQRRHRPRDATARAGDAGRAAEGAEDEAAAR